MFAFTPYTFQPLFHRFVTLFIYVQYVTDCITSVLSLLCCGCWTPPQISLSTSCAEIVELKDIVPDIAEDIKASGEPIQIRDIVIDIHQEQSSNCSVDINNEETKQLDISVDEKESVEVPSCSKNCNHLTVQAKTLVEGMNKSSLLRDSTGTFVV
ncbi:hypothetical protein KGM_209084 [Danaus plexippus plexippus]|uniref:Uncharacterized protein n=1 Tax=Danaus plexippus plexippus TaxID=278856 RepID=A0A212EIL5_DANPL|nr:uncharacterized protein LOC116775179 [Danaus plexippus plexippus]OWR41325.1 hypothetical protein KGM_209084 [Danaus plexippus plexippus]